MAALPRLPSFLPPSLNGMETRAAPLGSSEAWTSASTVFSKGQDLVEATGFRPPDENADLECVDVWSIWDFLRPVAEEGRGSLHDGGELHRRMLEDEELFYEKLREAQKSSGRTGLIGDMRGETLNLYALYKEVTCRGGLAQVVQNSRWEDVASALKWTIRVYFPLILSYLDLLYQFEKMYFSDLRHDAVQCGDGGHCTIPKIVKNTFADPLCNADISIALKRKRRQQLAPKVGFYVGATVTGEIVGKFESGYIITVTVGEEKLYGVLYHAETCVAKQFATDPVLVNTLSRDSEPIRPNGGIDSSKYVSERRSRRLINKDVDMPLGARSCYQIFIKEELCRMKKLKLDLDNKGIWKMVLNSWRCLPKDGRMVYIEKSRKDRERFEHEMAAYNMCHQVKQPMLEDKECPLPHSPHSSHSN